MKILITILSLSACVLCASAQTNSTFYLLSQQPGPPQPFNPDPSLPSTTNADGSVTVDDTWLELGRALMTSMDVPTPPGTGGVVTTVYVPPHVYPNFKLNTNILAGRTQSIAIMRSFLSKLPTNSAYLSNRNAEISHQLDWLATQAQQTMTNHLSITTNRP